ncbi:MAG: SIS domain-containing protein, partial [Dehalococcoidia bacterium]
MTTDPLAKLDDAALRERVDPSSFHRLLEALPQQARDAWALGQRAELPSMPAPRRVLLAGLGGSAIGADVVATLAADLCPIPVHVVRNYHLPPLTAETLVILCSFSGNTEETLEAFDAVAASDASGIAITTGGLLARRAADAGMPVITYAWDGPPRTGLGFGVFIPLAILRRLGVLDLPDTEVEAGLAALERSAAAYGLERDHNRAKSLAAWLHGGVPAVIGADMLEVAARRWAGEMSENAKQVASAYGIPEFNHNQLEAAARAGAEVGPLRFIILDAPTVHPRNRLRVQQTAEMML